MGLSHVNYVTLLPKSITTAIGMGVSEEAGDRHPDCYEYYPHRCDRKCTGRTGISHHGGAPPHCQGLALGTSAHAIGTAKALELGRLKGL